MRALPPAARKQLSDSCFLLTVEAGDLIVKQGMDERELYALVEGEAQVECDGIEVNRVGPGDVIGELALFKDTGRRTSSVRMVTPGQVLVVRYRFLYELLASHPESAFWVAHHLGRVMGERLESRTHMVAAGRREEA